MINGFVLILLYPIKRSDIWLFAVGFYVWRLHGPLISRQRLIGSFESAPFVISTRKHHRRTVANDDDNCYKTFTRAPFCFDFRASLMMCPCGEEIFFALYFPSLYRIRTGNESTLVGEGWGSFIQICRRQNHICCQTFYAEIHTQYIYRMRSLSRIVSELGTNVSRVGVCTTIERNTRQIHVPPKIETVFAVAVGSITRKCERFRKSIKLGSG